MKKLLLIVIAASILSTGCSGQPFWRKQSQDVMTAKDPQRDTYAAMQHNAAGVEHMNKGDLKNAEAEFKAATMADAFFGPAHNNLGTVYYKKKDYYQAAWEFQFAAKLMPGKSEPRNNLGLVLEAAGKLDQAAQSYEEALAIDKDEQQVIGNLARVYVRQERKDDRTKELLHKVVLNDSRPEWVAWARERLACFNQPASIPAIP